MESTIDTEDNNRRSLWKERAAVMGAAAGMAVLLASLRPDYMEHWDEIQLALGLEHFDLASHHPHPPGYYLFIVLGRLVNLVVGNPEDALRWVSILACAVGIVLVGSAFPKRLSAAARLALLSALAGFFILSPVILPFGIVALPYAGEAVCWLGVLLWISRRPRGWGLVGLLAFIGISAGLRQTLAVWGLAVFLLLTVRRRDSLGLRDAVRAVSGFVASVLVWFMPMLLETGGWETYVQTTHGLLGRAVWLKSVFVVGWVPVVFIRVPQMLSDLWTAAGPVLVLVLAAAVGRCHPRTRPLLARWDVLPLGAAIAFVFYSLMVYDSTGYILPVAIPLVAYGFIGVAEVAGAVGRRTGLAVCVGVTVVVSGFLLWPGGVLSEEGSRYHRLCRHDEAMEKRLTALRQRLAMYYLPEFTTLELVVDPAMVGVGPQTPYLVGRDRRIRFMGPYVMDVSSLPEFDPPHDLRNLVYMPGPKAARHVDRGCLLTAEELKIGTDDIFWVSAVNESAAVYVVRQQLVCRSR